MKKIQNKNTGTKDAIFLIIFFFIVLVASFYKKQMRPMGSFSVANEVFLIEKSAKKQSDPISAQKKVKKNTKLKKNEVLIKTSYAHIGLKDYYNVKNISQNSQYIPCSGGSGTVVDYGSNLSSEFRKGLKVQFYIEKNSLLDGACQQYVKIDRKYVSKKPHTLSMQKSATISYLSRFIPLITSCFEDQEVVSYVISNKNEGNGLLF